MEAVSDNKRRFKRIGFREPVSYQTIQGSHFGGCLGLDLSAGGLRFYFSDFLAPQTEMVFNFPLRYQYRASINGKVAWVQKLPHSEQYQIGVEFDRTTENIHTIKQV